MKTFRGFTKDMKTTDRKQRIALTVISVLIVLATLFIWSNSLKGPEQSDEESGFVVTLLKPFLSFIGIEEDSMNHAVRKAAHFAEFALLGILVFLLLKHVGKRFTGYGLFYGLSVAVIDEFIQSFTGRGTSVIDVLIDFSGFLFALLLGSLISFIAIRIKNRKT